MFFFQPMLAPSVSTHTHSFFLKVTQASSFLSYFRQCHFWGGATRSTFACFFFSLVSGPHSGLPFHPGHTNGTVVTYIRDIVYVNGETFIVACLSTSSARTKNCILVSVCIHMLFNMRHEVVGRRLDFPRLLAVSGLLSSTGSSLERHSKAVHAG